jgi:thiamine biosynthesis lipoprotein
VPIRVFVARDLWERFERECTKAPGGREGAAGPATAGEGIAVQHRFTHQAMATEFAIVISGGEAEYAGRAADAAFELLDRLEGELSRFRSASDVSRINGLAPGESIRVGPETIECLAAARRAYDETGGAFDPTVGPLVDLWRAGTPAAADLEVARARVGMDLLAVDAAERTVGARAAGMSVDLGGIGKGYALDRMAALLAEWRVRSALVHGGLSTALAVGPPPGEEAWRVEIRDPRQGGATLAVVALRDRALSVSGAGEGAPRLFDPRTGRPVEGRLGAWAIAPTATEADALSTAFMVMTPEEIASLCRKRPDLAAMVVPEGPAAGGSASPCVARFAEQGAERFGDWGS